MILSKLMLLSEDGSFDGMFRGARSVMGIILMVTGVLLIYIAVKVAKGYSFVPTLGHETIIAEDKYVEGEAEVLEKEVSKMPGLNDGEDREFIECKIKYTVDGEEYTHMIPDDDHSKGDMLKIKYDPKKPDAFYLVGEEEEETEAPDETDDADKSKSMIIGVILIVLGLLVIAGGAALFFI